VLRDFAFAIVAGILIGTYSSIFVASPIVLWWSRFRGKSLRREVLETEAMRQQARSAA
jgi:SecD/SecF fusion protein